MCAFLQNWVRNLIDFSKSVVGHLDNFDRIEAYLAAGENVILLANHQSEADPGAPRRAQGSEALLQGSRPSACVSLLSLHGWHSFPAAPSSRSTASIPYRMESPCTGSP